MHTPEAFSQKKLWCQAGFTLVELVVMITIIGIIATIAVPRFFEQRTFDTRRFADLTTSMLRYGQKIAIAQHTNVFVVMTASSVSLCYDAGCAGTVKDPANGNNAFVGTAPTGVTLSPAPTTFSFDAQGIPSFAARLNISVTGDSTRNIFVERETGYVHS